MQASATPGGSSYAESYNSNRRDSSTWTASITVGEHSRGTNGFDDRHSEQIYDRLADEAEYIVIGPMPTGEFLKEFMDRDRILAEYPGISPSVGLFEKLRNVKGEKQMYAPLTTALNSPGPDKVTRCHGFIFKNTSNDADEAHGKLGSFKPDLCCYSIEHDGVAELGYKADTDVARSSMTHAALFVEVKSSVQLDSFMDPPANADRPMWKFVVDHNDNPNHTEAKDARQAFGQQVAYATEILARQHRHCCYSVSLSGTSARLIRWDRAGAIVSTSFDLLQSPSILCEFIWCFGWIGDEGRGYDLTIETASKTEELIFKNAIERHLQEQLRHEDEKTRRSALAEHYQEGVRPDLVNVSRLKMMCPGGGNRSQTLTLLICRPVSYPLSPAGRGTRGYWAVDAEDPHEVFFLKDTWRYTHLGSTPARKEGDIICSLLAHAVPNVPEVKCHHDVLVTKHVLTRCDDGTVRLLLQNQPTVQVTRTQDYLEAPWACGVDKFGGKIRGRIAGHTHYRLVLKQVGFPLIRFTGTAELLRATHDALKALATANRKLKIVHRDINPMNIILVWKSRHGQSGTSELRNRRGYLIDWDLACREDEAGDGQPPYSAAWQYTSEVIASGLKPYRYPVALDMESLLYVVLHMSILWLPHDQTDDVIAYVLKKMFDQGGRSGEPSGGNGKKQNKIDRRFSRGFRWNCRLMHDWLNVMLDTLAPVTPPPIFHQPVLKGDNRTEDRKSLVQDDREWPESEGPGENRQEPPLAPESRSPARSPSTQEGRFWNRELNQSSMWTLDVVEAFWAGVANVDVQLPDNDRRSGLPVTLTRKASRIFQGTGHSATGTAPFTTSVSKRNFEAMLDNMQLQTASNQRAPGAAVPDPQLEDRSLPDANVKRKKGNDSGIVDKLKTKLHGLKNFGRSSALAPPRRREGYTENTGNSVAGPSNSSATPLPNPTKRPYILKVNTPTSKGKGKGRRR